MRLFPTLYELGFQVTPENGRQYPVVSLLNGVNVRPALTIVPSKFSPTTSISWRTTVSPCGIGCVAAVACDGS